MTWYLLWYLMLLMWQSRQLWHVDKSRVMTFDDTDTGVMTCMMTIVVITLTCDENGQRWQLRWTWSVRTSMTDTCHQHNATAVMTQTRRQCQTWHQLQTWCFICVNTGLTPMTSVTYINMTLQLWWHTNDINVVSTILQLWWQRHNTTDRRVTYTTLLSDVFLIVCVSCMQWPCCY